MSENITFRSSLSGFNRSDVMNYISTLMEEKTAFEKELAETKKQLREAKDKVKELEKQLEDAGDCKNCELSRKNEEKIGAAMLDARRFSEIIVEEANEKSAAIYDAACTDAFEISESVAEISKQVLAVSDEYATAFKELWSKTQKLSETLKKSGEQIEKRKNVFCAYAAKNQNEKTEAADRKPEKAKIVKKQTSGDKDSAARAKQKKTTAKAPQKAVSENSEKLKIAQETNSFVPDFDFLDSDGEFSIKIEK